ncbi:MAG: hypothetical protein AAF214_01560 [Pseudomonadota bacterium]
MAEFRGTDFQIAVQKRMQARHIWIKDAPDIANGGRVLNIISPQITGWDRIAQFMEQDGVLALIAQPRATIWQDVAAAFGDTYDMPAWDVYTSDAATVTQTCRAYLAAHQLPEGWSVTCHDCPDDGTVNAVQTLNLHTGVAPYPAFYTRSDCVATITGCVWNDAGDLVATSSLNARYHPASRLSGYVFKGATSVHPDARGHGLGKFVNAHVLLTSHARMGWDFALSQVAASNIASQKTIIGAGFARAADLVTIGLVRKGEVFTR